MSVQEDAQAVKQVLQEHGWCQGGYRDSHGRVCLLGAIFYMAVIEQIDEAEHDALVDAIRAKLRDRMEFMLPGMIVPISLWNDKPGRTVEEVYELLDSIGA